MFVIGVLFTLLVSINLAVFWLWIVKRISDRGYGQSSRAARVSQMMPVVDRTVVVERREGAADRVRTIMPEAGATAGGV